MSGDQLEDDEYEYEYSATETETHYLTLDLSLPDFIQLAPDDAAASSRSGYRIWYNAPFNKSDPHSDAAGYIEENAEADDEDLPEREDDEDNAAASRLAGSDNGDGPQQADALENAEMEKLKSIQILELHSDNPLVAYRNTILRGTWMENMGTEMIFGARDSANPLPALRNLPDDVDLLAASRTRINFLEVDMEPKKATAGEAVMTQGEKHQAVEDRLKRNGGVYVNVFSDKSGDRVPQACFLEDLTAIKRKRGEQDEVTIVALDPPPNGASVEDEIRMRRHRRNVKSSESKRRKAAHQAEIDAARARGDEAPVRLGAGRPRKKYDKDSVWFPKGDKTWARHRSLIWEATKDGRKANQQGDENQERADDNDSQPGEE